MYVFSVFLKKLLVLVINRGRKVADFGLLRAAYTSETNGPRSGSVHKSDERALFHGVKNHKGRRVGWARYFQKVAALAI